MIGALGSLELVGQITGPLIGGSFTTNVSWRWCFLINVPLGVASGLAVFLLLRGSKQQPWSDVFAGLRTTDAVGILLTIPGSAAILFVIQSGGSTFAWDSPTIIGLAVAGGVLLVILFFWERSRGDLAVLPSKLFRNRNVVFGATFAVGVNMAVSLFDYFVSYIFPLGDNPSSAALIRSVGFRYHSGTRQSEVYRRNVLVSCSSPSFHAPHSPLYLAVLWQPTLAVPAQS